MKINMLPPGYGRFGAVLFSEWKMATQHFGPSEKPLRWWKPKEPVEIPPNTIYRANHDESGNLLSITLDGGKVIELEEICDG